MQLRCLQQMLRATLLPEREQRSFRATKLVRIRMTHYTILLLATVARNKVA